MTHPPYGDPAAPAARVTPRWAPVAIILAIAIIVAAHLVGRVGAFCSPVHADSFVYATVGYRIAQGEVFYRDVADVKPPGLYMLYALAYRFLPPGRSTMIPVDTVFALLGYFAVHLLARDLYGRKIAWIVTVTAVLAFNYFPMMDFATDGFGLAESFMIFPIAMAARQYLRSAAEHRTKSLLACGFWIGVAMMIKQTALPLAVAVAGHWTVSQLIARRESRAWLRGTAAGIAGATIALAPFVVMVVLQGTSARAFELLGPRAAGMLNRETAWPSQWSSVLPLWVPMAWCGLAVFWRAENTLLRHRHDASQASGPMGFLLLWVACECVMLVYLPLRASHYYTASCLPLVVLSGAFWSTLTRRAATMPPRTAVACLAAAATVSVAMGRPIADDMVPVAVARYRAYDVEADQAYFDRLLALKINTFGAPQPGDE